MEPRFIHLRLHTEYSLIDGLVQIKPLVDEAVKCRMPAPAITDQANLFGMVKFYQAAMNVGVKPIIGADLWLENDTQAKQPFRLTVLCQNQQGYKNLLKLLSQGYREGQAHGKAIINRDWLKDETEGLIALSGAKEGDVGQALLADDLLKQKLISHFWTTLFPDRYFIELQRTGRPQEESYIHAALELAERFEIPVVATNDIRFISKEDFEAHEARVCIHEGLILADPRRPKIYTD